MSESRRATGAPTRTPTIRIVQTLPDGPRPWPKHHSCRRLPPYLGVCHAESLPGRRESRAPCALAHEGSDVSEGRRRVTGSRRQARRRGASVTVAVPPMRCIRAGPLVRGRLGVLGGRSGSTCDASVLAIDPCSQCRRRGWMWRYPLVKTRPGPSTPRDEPVANRTAEFRRATLSAMALAVWMPR